MQVTQVAAVVAAHVYGRPGALCWLVTAERAVPGPELARLLRLPAPAEPAALAALAAPRAALALRRPRSALLLRPLVLACVCSPRYRRALLAALQALAPAAGTLYLKLKLRPPDREIIDYSWNERMLREVWMRVEIDCALSWLSTLGGAFSALGDYFDSCAEMAGKISIRQLQLSLVLGDESLAARSRLYSSLALAQQGKLKLARHVVRSVADFSRLSKDRRLMRMCQGVWAKLRYLRKINYVATLNMKGGSNRNRKSNLSCDLVTKT